MTDTAKMVLLVVASAMLWIVVPSLLTSLMALVFLTCCFDFLQRRRRSVVRDLNSALRAVCHQQGSLSKVATAFSRRGPLQRPCYEFSRRLLGGEHPIDAAVASRVPLQLATAVAIESPDWQPSLMSHSDQMESELVGRDMVTMPVYAQLFYLAISVLASCLVLTFVSIFIVPTFEQMFEEFGLEMTLGWIIRARPPGWMLALFLLGGIIAVTTIMTGRLLGLRLRWLPTTPGAASARAEVLRGLADAIDAGWPIGRALAISHALTQRPGIRRDLEMTMRLIQQGVPTITAMHQVGWIDATQAGWLSGASSERMAELLLHFADQSVRDAALAMRWIMTFFFPAVILMLGLTIMLYAFGLYGTLASLINGLS